MVPLTNHVSTERKLEWLAEADVPFRAWAATALLSAKSGGFAQRGREIASELADDAARVDALDHADLAGYAILAKTGLLRTEQIDRVLASIPFPHADRRIRSKFFGSSVYVYLFARGLGARYEHRDSLVRAIDDELVTATDRGEPDLFDLLLMFGARLELAAKSVNNDLIRRVRGRVAAAPKTAIDSLASRWLLDLYQQKWPEQAEALSLRESLREFVQAAGTSSQHYEARPAALAMELELIVRRQPHYQLVSREERDAMIASQLGVRRWTESGAYIVAIGTVLAVPMTYVSLVKALPPLVGWSSVLGLGIPVISLALRAAWGRAKQLAVHSPAIAGGAVYYAAAIYAAYFDRSMIAHLTSEGILLAVGPIVLAAIFAPIRDSRS